MNAAAHTRTEIGRSALFFGLTLCSSTWAFRTFHGTTWSEGMRFAAALMTILVAHEMGHYVVARRHGFSLSLPIFIPFPSIFGTAGAVIQLRSLPSSREALLEMGAAGPLAGAVVSVAVLIASFGPAPVPTIFPPLTEMGIFNDPLLVKAIGWSLTGEVPSRYALYSPGMWAGWVGCFLTGMNLVPLGQLDGGHVLNALLGRRVPQHRYAVLGGVAALGVLWHGWWVWLVLLLVMGAARPMEGVPDSGRLSLRARLVAVAVLVLFVLTFIPVPMEQDVFGP